MTDTTRPASSLRTELLLQLAVLVLATLVIAVAGALLFVQFGEGTHAAAWLALLMGLDVAVLVAFGGYLLNRLVLRPLRDTLAAAEAIAAGDLDRRVAPGDTTEFQSLARSLNRMTDRLLEERRHLVRAEKLASIGRLGAGVAHEIGNPLGAIHGYLHLARSGTSDPAARDALAGLEREANRIDRIVRGLLDYARGRRPTPAPVDVNGAARTVVEMLRAQGAFRGVRVSTDLASDAPAITGDRHDLEQLFVNLLLNAVDAMRGEGDVTIHTRRLTRAELEREGRGRSGDPSTSSGQVARGVAPEARVREPSPRVRLWLDAADRPDEAVKIVVADSGPGIPQEDAERVFDPFFTTKEPGKGTGLGLAIVLRIVDNARGTIWVETAREGGAAFHILFPVVSARGSVIPTLSPRERAKVEGVERRRAYETALPPSSSSLRSSAGSESHTP